MRDYPVEKTVRVLSLGAGVQSSTLALLYSRGELGPAPDFAVFADTGAEPESVYRWLEHLKQHLTYPLVICSAGNIAEDTLGKSRFASAPFWIKSEDGTGVVRRQCTSEYKLKPIYKAVRQELGYNPGERVRRTVEMIIGISTDEIYRVKPSRLPWVKNLHPLVFERQMNRHDCVRYMRASGLGEPPRSACWMCPYRSNKEWLHLKEHDPDDWRKAVKFDRAIRTLPKFKHENFLHRDLLPLDQVELDPHKDQMSLFDNECEGMCGV